MREVTTIIGDRQLRKDCIYILGDYYLTGRDYFLQNGLPIIVEYINGIWVSVTEGKSNK